MLKPRPRSSGTSYDRPFTDEQRDWLRFAEKYQRDNHIRFMHKTDWLDAAKLFLGLDEARPGPERLHRLVLAMAERIFAHSELLSKRAEVKV
jgi:hypothetical protein